MYCGNNEMATSCNLCPTPNETQPIEWCGGNCYYDESTKLCKEGKTNITRYQIALLEIDD